MSIKHILMPIVAVDDFEPVAVSAMTLAHMFGSHVQFVYQRNGGGEHHHLMRNFGAVPVSQFSEILDSHRRDLDSQTQAVRAGLEDLAQRTGITLQATPTSSVRPSASWHETYEPITDVIAHAGGVSNLIVVGQPEETHEDPAKTMMGAALFASGRPVLMIPDEGPIVHDFRVVIGWNRSIQAGRGVSSALPFLHQASSVVIVSIATGAKKGPSARELADYLSWHDVEPEVKEVSPNDRQVVGDMLLAEAEEAGGDLLVMGAYSHSRIREMLWGGVTKHIASHARLPVLMAH
ncbi:MAG: universal stress protein [Geminicoccaceae bacterium]